MNNIELFCGDCLDIMPTLQDNSVDMVLCDLPYGTTQNKWDAVIPFGKLWEQYKRICKGVIVLTASQPFTSALVMSNPSWFRYEWVWVKNKSTGHLNAKKMPMKRHESVLVFSEKPCKYLPQMSEGHKPVNKFYTRDNGENYGTGSASSGGGSTQRYPSSVLEFPVVNNDSDAKTHPTQKPVELMEYLINTYTTEGSTVLDNCMGSGTTGVACQNTNRNFIGIEKDEGYFSIAKARIESLYSADIVT